MRLGVASAHTLSVRRRIHPALASRPGRCKRPAGVIDDVYNHSTALQLVGAVGRDHFKARTQHPRRLHLELRCAPGLVQHEAPPGRGFTLIAGPLDCLRALRELDGKRQLLGQVSRKGAPSHLKAVVVVLRVEAGQVNAAWPTRRDGGLLVVVVVSTLVVVSTIRSAAGLNQLTRWPGADGLMEAHGRNAAHLRSARAVRCAPIHIVRSDRYLAGCAVDEDGAADEAAAWIRVSAPGRRLGPRLGQHVVLQLHPRNTRTELRRHLAQ
mmetsp:Transcript_21700/g.54277  ORF Transcript_21700/g.54277 Transcript_21700/m.54277 type:complete len:267 (+) Transcript_21700:202-1002(+)